MKPYTAKLNLQPPKPKLNQLSTRPPKLLHNQPKNYFDQSNMTHKRKRSDSSSYEESTSSWSNDENSSSSEEKAPPRKLRKIHDAQDKIGRVLYEALEHQILKLSPKLTKLELIEEIVKFIQKTVEPPESVVDHDTLMCFPKFYREKIGNLIAAKRIHPEGSTDHHLLSEQIQNVVSRQNAKLSPSNTKKLATIHLISKRRKVTLTQILEANITKEDQVRAIELYDKLYDPSQPPDNIEAIDSKLEAIIASQFTTKEELKAIEDEERATRKKNFLTPATIRKRISELDAPKDVKGTLYGLYCEMNSRNPGGGRYNDIMDKLSWALKLPYNKTTLPSELSEGVIEKVCLRLTKELDKKIYGMDKVKDAVIRAINDRLHNPNAKAIIALTGDPGVGKTKIAKIIAEAIGTTFDKISLGGAIDVTTFKGSNNVWSGANPSMIIQILAKRGISDCLVLLDEVDKLTTSDRGVAVQHSLLHVLDPTQNKEFQDEFLCEFPHDISRMIFVLSMNSKESLDPALKDRVEIIEVPGYTVEEKMAILKHYILPETVYEKGFKKESMSISEGACKKIVLMSANESGMRSVEKVIGKVISTISYKCTMRKTHEIPGFSAFPYVIGEECVDAFADKKEEEVMLSYYS